MKTLITPAQVVALAFADGGYIAPEAITVDDIAVAEQRYIVPVIGHALYDQLIDGLYADFTTAYLAAPVALFTRILVQPGLDIRTGQCGTVAPRSETGEPAADSRLRALKGSLRTKARTLLRTASDYLKRHPEQFPEYNDHENILNHCSIHGNLIQTH